MNLLLIEPEELQDGRVFLTDRRAEHLRTILKVLPGQELRLGILGRTTGARAQARVLDCSTARVLLEVSAPMPEAAPPPWIDLAIALPRPQALHRILQNAAAMGIGRLDFLRTWRVEKSFFASPSLRPEEIRRQLILGAEQGVWTRLPEIAIHHRLADYLAEPRSGVALVAHPEIGTTLEGLALDFKPPEIPLRVAIGPEGGFLEREVGLLIEHGYRAFDLGPAILRVEVAAVAIVAQLELLRRQSLGKPAH
jgi:16S rRNA (uracil1498-N3)-methyltransferase